MAKFVDTFSIRLGEVTVKGRRLTLKEIREYGAKFAADALSIEESVELISKCCTLADGTKFDPLELSDDQARKLIAEIVLPRKGRQISDFIALFS